MADVQTNFSMPDVISIGLGGGSIIDRDAATVGLILSVTDCSKKAWFSGDRC